MRSAHSCLAIACCALCAWLSSMRPGAAWGPEGHRIIAVIADHALEQSDPAARAKVAALLATDTGNNLTKTDIASEATWADVLRQRSEEARTATTAWHYVRFNADNPDLQRACFGRPALPPGYPAGHGPQDACVVDKIEQFAKELADPATNEGERRIALQFMLNLVGDLHEPLYAIDHGDDGSDCVAIVVDKAASPVRLLTYWDETLVAQVGGGDPAKGAAQVTTGLAAEEMQKWAGGTPEDWARESYDVAKIVAYAFSTDSAGAKYNFPKRTRDDANCGPVPRSTADAAYESKARDAVKQQLAKAGIRLATLLHESLK
jgi:hypothetical protein